MLGTYGSAEILRQPTFSFAGTGSVPLTRNKVLVPRIDYRLTLILFSLFSYVRGHYFAFVYEILLALPRSTYATPRQDTIAQRGVRSPALLRPSSLSPKGDFRSPTLAG